MTTKLIIVEGMWGSGKSTTAQLIDDHLTKSGVDTRLYLEGDLDHPADYDQVACFSRDEYKQFLQRHLQAAGIIQSITETKDRYCFIEYGKLKQRLGELLADEVLADIARYDIYDGVLPLDRHCEVQLDRWREFVRGQREKETVMIFECCFIQNPLSAMLGRYDASERSIVDYVLELGNIIRPLNPALIYFHPGDVRTALARTFEERSPGWRDGVIEYYTRQGYGKSHGLSGFDGLVEFLRLRTDIELKIVQQLTLRKLIVKNDDLNWARVHREIADFVHGSL